MQKLLQSSSGVRASSADHALDCRTGTHSPLPPSILWFAGRAQPTPSLGIPPALCTSVHFDFKPKQPKFLLYRPNLSGLTVVVCRQKSPDVTQSECWEVQPKLSMPATPRTNCLHHTYPVQRLVCLPYPVDSRGTQLPERRRT